MNGYLKPVRMSREQRLTWRSYLCGLCHHLGATHGLRYRLLATADGVFYNVLLDLLADGLAPIEMRPCVLTPGLVPLPSRVETANTRLAAALSLVMAVEKLRDDVTDEGGAARRLALRLAAPGLPEARRVLADAGFPLDVLDQGLQDQRAVEAGDALDLAEAAGPTARISAAVFAFAARGGEAAPILARVGDAVGRYLFYMDNVLDFPADTRNGAYNAIARALHVRAAPARVPPEVLAAGLDGAEQALADLRDDLSLLRVPNASYLAHTLLLGFDDKLRRLRDLAPDRRARADFSALLPPRESFLQVARGQVVGAWSAFTVRAWVSAGLLLSPLLPRVAWARTWWPEASRALPGDLATPSVVPAALQDPTVLPSGPSVDLGLSGIDPSSLVDTGLQDAALDVARSVDPVTMQLAPTSDPCTSLCASVGYCQPTNECEVFCNRNCDACCPCFGYA